MARRKIYEGTNSCYARNEGIYVAGDGVDLAAAAAIAKLILNDVARHYSYAKEDCRPIHFTWDDAVMRLRYLIALAKKHHGEEEAAKVRELVNYVIQHGQLPEWAEELARSRIKQIYVPEWLVAPKPRKKLYVYA